MLMSKTKQKKMSACKSCATAVSYVVQIQTVALYCRAGENVPRFFFFFFWSLRTHCSAEAKEERWDKARCGMGLGSFDYGGARVGLCHILRSSPLPTVCRCLSLASPRRLRCEMCCT